MARDQDIEIFFDHLTRHQSESGQDGDLIFTPAVDGDLSERSLEKFTQTNLAPWAKSVTEIGWSRTWIATLEDRVVGHLSLKHSPELGCALHRAVLMMGVEREARGQGWGSQLLTTAIQWAREQESIDWLQLYVFSHNWPARKLYERFGFYKTGSTPDLFRIDGESIDDVEMVLRVPVDF
jgi:ribosomal protein S18 acetylase RimI-like enzyme